MSIEYCTNNIVLLVSITPKDSLDIDHIFSNEKGATKYRGSIHISRDSHSLKITKNGFIYFFIKNSFQTILHDIQQFILDSSQNILKLYSKKKFTHINIDVVNIQISISISLEKKSFKLVELFLKLRDNLKNKYHFKIKESNTYESVWLEYNEIRHNHIISLSSFRIVDNNITFTLSHNFKGSCITKNPSIFLELCSEINKAISELK